MPHIIAAIGAGSLAPITPKMPMLRSGTRLATPLFASSEPSLVCVRYGEALFLSDYYGRCSWETPELVDFLGTAKRDPVFVRAPRQESRLSQRRELDQFSAARDERNQDTRDDTWLVEDPVL